MSSSVRSSAARGRAGARRAKGTPALHGRRLHGGGLRAANRARGDADGGGESEDPDRVIAAVRELGLVAPHNISVPRKLKALAWFAARRDAVIDVGTNSVKFHIGERAGWRWRAIVDRAESLAGQDLEEHGRLGDDAIERTAQAIAGMAEEERGATTSSPSSRSVPPAALAPNRAELIDAVRHVHGVDVEVIPGDEQARLAYLATASELDVGDGTIADLRLRGGISSSRSAAGRTSRSGSAPTSARWLHGAVRPGWVGRRSHADGRSSQSRPISRGWMIGSRSSASSAWAARSRTSPPSSTASRSTTATLCTAPSWTAPSSIGIELYRMRDADQRREIVGLRQPSAGHPRGSLHRARILTKLGRESLTVSDRGLRHGLLVERFPHPR